MVITLLTTYTSVMVITLLTLLPEATVDSSLAVGVAAFHYAHAVRLARGIQRVVQ